MPRIIYHVHLPDGRRFKVPSVTTVLRNWGSPDGLMHWAYGLGLEAARAEYEEGIPAPERLSNAPRTAANIGTIVHAMIECDVQGIDFDASLHDPDLVAKAAVGFRNWDTFSSMHTVELIAAETSLTSMISMYGGTLDLVVNLDGQRTLLDIKTGKAYKTHLWQVAAYAALWTENRPDQPLADVGILYLNIDGEGYEWKPYPAMSPAVIDAARAFLHCLSALKIERAQDA